MMITCASCGKEEEAQRASKKYCSTACRVRAHYHRQPAKMSLKEMVEYMNWALGLQTEELEQELGGPFAPDDDYALLNLAVNKMGKIVFNPLAGKFEESV